MDADRALKVQERENLRNIIAQWNANRLDLFELSEPNEDLEFHGVMRFYFQDAGQKVATKCIRVASSAMTITVIETLIEKFRPDMRMLSIPEYALYEIHESGAEERKLGEEEKPLLVQLNWHKDDREGRFLLRRMDEKTFVTHQTLDDGTHFKRKLSKREKKEKKKREKIQKAKTIEEEEDKDGIAEKLYTEMPETSFTRSISNPEAVMRRRRQQKLEKKLQQFRSKDGGPDTGGTLKIYGETLCKDVPYKTLLLSVRDNAAFVVKEMLDKYGMDREDPANYCLVQVLVGGEQDNREYQGGNGGQKEFILDEDECPLAILMNHHPARGSPIFHIQRRPGDYQHRKRKKKPKSKGDLDGYPYPDGLDRLEPFFLELNQDGTDVVSCAPKRYALGLNVTEVGSERGVSDNVQHLQLFGPNVYPRHCVIAHTEGIVTVTPCNRDAETFVNGQRIYETTILQHRMVVRFGTIHCFRFVDPNVDERRQRHDSVGRHQNDVSYDRHSMKDDSSLHHSFDNDGNSEAVSTSSLKDDRRSDRPVKQVHDAFDLQRRGHDPILPAILELWDEGEDSFLTSTISDLDTAAVQFKLAPTYTLYMAARFRASTHYRQEIVPTERAHRLTTTLAKVANKIQLVIQDRCLEAGSLAFWMANSSELLHFLKQDRHLSPFCVDAQDILAECVQIAFRNLVHCMQNELLNSMPAFLEDRDDTGEEEGSTGEVLAVLSSAMALLRRCRVNAALTIQLFSQLFHFINMWLFNRVVCDPRPTFCTRSWGARLKCRLARVEMWAEKQGLELAADCHLSRILQAADLLQYPKSTPEDLSAITASCFKLNSLQLRSLLERYQPMHDEPHIPQVIVENVIKVAESTADEMARSDGRDVRLEEDPDLQLPFLLPEDGYSCDIVRGVPAGLQEFVSPFQRVGLCRLTIQPSSSGYWTIYMTENDSVRSNHRPRSSSVQSYHGDREPARIPGSSPEPELATIKLQKSNSGMGLSIVAARGVGQDKLGIYIKSVVKGGAADLDGRLQAGDQLLKVDGQSLVGISQEKAAEYMTRTGHVVHLEVAKEGAMYHGLATLLSQPSPIIHRDGDFFLKRRSLSFSDLVTDVTDRTNGDFSVPIQPKVPLPANVCRPLQSSSSRHHCRSCHCPFVATNGAISLSASSDPSYSGSGYPGGRRMSERDLHSKVLRDQNQDPNDPRHANGGPPSVLPRMQSSKSVPSLNSGGGGTAPQEQFWPPSPNGPRPQPHEVYNPAYSRTSSTTSIVRSGPEMAGRDQTLRALSTNNLRQAGYLDQGSQQGPPPPMRPHNADAGHRGRPLSQPNLHQDEERHYQNISMYQHQQNQQVPVSHSMQTQVAQQNVPLPIAKTTNFGHSEERMSQRLRGSQGSLYRPPDPSQQQPNVAAIQRPLSAVIPQWDREQVVGSAAPVSPPAHQQQAWARTGDNQWFQQQQQMRAHGKTQDGLNFPDDHQGGAPLGTRSGPGLGDRNRGLDGGWRSERDLLRQEAKMEEMREEIRRREERISRERKIQELQQQQQRYPGPANNLGSQGTVRFDLHQGASHSDRGQLLRGPPPTTPKPRFPTANQLPPQHRPPYGGQDVAPERPPPPSDELLVHRDSPQPPPPPPSTTHPLYHHHQQQQPVRGSVPAVYRYGPGGLPLSRSAEHFDRLPPHEERGGHEGVPQSRSFINQSEGSLSALSPSPWDREEKERERKRRLDEARRLRDQEIDELENAQQRSAKQEERLRTLRLEKEFQRRAEELKNDEDDENEEDDDVMDRRGFLRLVQEDLERARLKRLERENERLQNQQQQEEARRQMQMLEQSRAAWKKDGPQTQQQVTSAAGPNSTVAPNRSEEWLRRQQEIKEQRRELQQHEEQQQRLMRERQQKLDDANRKREQKKEQERVALRELQNAREAEERLMREAQKRQEDEIRRERAIQQHHQHQLYNHQKNVSMLSPPYGQYIQSGVGYGGQDNNAVVHSGPMYSHHVVGQATGAQRLDTLLMSQQIHGGGYVQSESVRPSHGGGGGVGPVPQMNGNSNVPPPPLPPERKGSYNAMSQIESNQWEGSAVTPKEAVPGVKKVSFHDTKLEDQRVLFDSYGGVANDGEMHMLTPNNTTQQQMNTFTVGSTPGVIGAQEVYRDPRQRIEASRNPIIQTPKGPGPEQLSFREKMKKFALETGENNTPRDKVKISKAQREIETNLTVPAAVRS